MLRRTLLFAGATLLQSPAPKPPVVSLDEAERRYGPLTSEYKMTKEGEWIVPFDFSIFGIDKVARVNKDMVRPLKSVARELSSKGLLKEITDFRGCFASRPVRGKRKPSVHAYGLGCDFNHTKFSKEFVTVWKNNGFNWGGDFCSWKDWMHFSYAWERGNCSFYSKEI